MAAWGLMAACPPTTLCNWGFQLELYCVELRATVLKLRGLVWNCAELHGVYMVAIVRRASKIHLRWLP